MADGAGVKFDVYARCEDSVDARVTEGSKSRVETDTQGTLDFSLTLRTCEGRHGREMLADSVWQVSREAYQTVIVVRHSSDKVDEKAYVA
jgi:hypothetical protein